MKSLSITVLVSIVLLAAGLIVVYKTPTPESSAQTYVLRIIPSEVPAAAAKSNADDAPAPKVDDSLLARQKDGWPVDSKADTGLPAPAQSEPALSGLKLAEGAPGALEPEKSGDPAPFKALPEDAQAPQVPPGGRALPDDRPDDRLAAAQEPRSGPLERAAEPPVIAPPSDEKPEAPPAEAPAQPDPEAGSDAEREKSPAAPAGAPAATGQAAKPLTADPEPGKSPAAETAVIETPWQTATVSRSKEPQTALPIEPNPNAVARQPLPPAPASRVEARPPIPRLRSSKTEAVPAVLKTAGTEERNAAETKTALTTIPRPAEGQPNAARIAIIIRDLGLDERDTYNAISNLKAEITLAFSPYGRDAKGWALKARQDGHEVFLGIPMEPNPPQPASAPNMLLASLPKEENLKRLDWAFSQIGDFDGLINIMGGKLSQTPEAIQTLMEALQARGLPYIDDGEAAHPFAILLASQLNLRYRVADLRFAARPAADETLRDLQRVEKLARDNGTAVLVAASDPQTIREIIVWSSNLPEKGIKVIPASEIVGVANLR